MEQSGGHRFPTRLVAALATCWGLLAWANWIDHNPLVPRDVVAAFTDLAGIRPGPALAAWGSHLARLLLVGVFALSALGAGEPVRRWLARRPGPFPGFVAAVLGAGLASLAILGAGLIGLLFRGTAWIVLAAAAVAGLPWLRKPAWGWVLRGDTLPFAILLAVALFTALLGALAPEVSFDALAHHLAHPAVWAAAHRIHALPFHFLALFPAVLEMQYLAAILLDGPQSAKLVHFGWGLFTIAALIAWARRSLPGAWALAAAATFALLPYVQTVLMWAYVDLGAAGCLTVAFMAACEGPAAPALLGALCGITEGTKATGVFAPVLVGAVLVLRRMPARGWLPFAAAAFLAAAPWGARNWAWTGNPFAPFLSGLFPTLWWDAGNQARYTKELTSYQLGHAPVGSPVAFLAHPWSASILNFGVLDQQSGMGAWFLWLVPLLAVAGVPAARLPAGLALGFFLLWFLVPRQVRYLLPAWPAAAVAAAHALRGVAVRGGTGLVAAWMAGIMLVTGLMGAFQREHRVINPVRVVFGSETPSAYYSRGLPGTRHTVRASEWIRDNADGGRLLVASHYGLNLIWGPRAIAQAAFDTPVIERAAREGRDPARIAVKLRQLGVTRILYATMGGFTMHAVYEMYGFDPGSAARWREFWTARSLLEANLDDRYQVWRVAAAPTGRKVASVLPGLDEQWLGSIDWDLQYAAQTATDPTAMAAALAKAESEYRAVAVREACPAAWERVGTVHLRQGRTAEAERDLLQAERFGRDTAVLHDALGVLAAREGRASEAVRRFRKSLAVDPGLVDARRNLAALLWSLGDRNAAMGTLREGLALDPGAGELRDLLARWTGSAEGMP